MSPDISAANANILMESDYFILPCAPDYFCYMAIDSLTKVFPRWDKAYSKLKETDVFMLVKNKLIPVLKNCNMIIPYMSNYYDEEYNLINIADFNSLIAQSQANNTPVFMLTQEIVAISSL